MNSQTVEIVNRVLPILLLLLLGHWTRRSGFLTEELVDGLPKIVVNIALPAVLFISFLTVELKSSFIALAVIIFGLCVALFILGRFLGPRVQPDHPYFKFLMTGFEYGMLGVSLFGSARISASLPWWTWGTSCLSGSLFCPYSCASGTVFKK